MSTDRLLLAIVLAATAATAGGLYLLASAYESHQALTALYPTHWSIL